MNDMASASPAYPVPGAVSPAIAPAPAPRSLWRRWKILLLILVIFILGVLIGVVAGVGLSIKMAVQVLRLENWTQRTIQDYRRQLKLTLEQTASIKEIVARYQPAMMEMRNRALREAGAVHARMDAEIQALLTPEQRARWAEIKKRREAEFRKAFKLPAPTTNPPLTQPSAATP